MRNIFLKVLFLFSITPFCLNSQDEFDLYAKVADILEKDILKPDLVVYLQAETSRLMQNIRKRGRKIEKGITSDYINQVNEKYQEFFLNFEEERSLLIINTTNIDFVNNEDDYENILQLIKEPVNGIKYFNPGN